MSLNSLLENIKFLNITNTKHDHFKSNSLRNKVIFSFKGMVKKIDFVWMLLYYEMLYSGGEGKKLGLPMLRVQSAVGTKQLFKMCLQVLREISLFGFFKSYIVFGVLFSHQLIFNIIQMNCVPRLKDKLCQKRPTRLTIFEIVQCFIIPHP